MAKTLLTGNQLSIESAGLTIATYTPPLTYANAGNIKLAALDSGAYSQFGPISNTRDGSFQSYIPDFSAAIYRPLGNSTTINTHGMTVTTAGTVTARNVATTNVYTRNPRVGFVSAAGAGSITELRDSAAKWMVGNSVKGAGFYFVAEFSLNDIPSGQRFFCGVAPAGAATNVEPSSLTNCIGVAVLSTANNFQIVYGGASAQTPINLGITYPSNTSFTDMYRAEIWSPFAATTNVQYRLTRLNTGDIATGNIAANLPASTQLLAPKIWHCNNATASSASFDLWYMMIKRSTNGLRGQP